MLNFIKELKAMSNNEWKEMSRTMTEGLARAEYQMVRKKAERNMLTLQGTTQVPARELLEKLYHEEVG